MKNKYSRLLVVTLLLIFLTACSSSSYPKTEIPEPDGNYYIDQLDVLTDETKQFINETSKNLENQNGAQIFVLTIDNLTEEPFQFAVDTFNTYGLGDKEKDNGLLIMVATLAEGGRRIEVIPGYGLEGILPDGRIGRIIDEYMIDFLKVNEYDRGIKAGYERFAEIIGDPENNKETLGYLIKEISIAAVPYILAIALGAMWSVIEKNRDKNRQEKYKEKYNEYLQQPFRVLFDDTKRELSETSGIKWNDDGSFTNLKANPFITDKANPFNTDENEYKLTLKRLKSDVRWLSLSRILQDRIKQEGLPTDLEISDYRVMYTITTYNSVHEKIFNLCMPLILDIYDLEENPEITFDFLVDVADKYKNTFITLDKHILYKYFYDLEDSLPEDDAEALVEELKRRHSENPEEFKYKAKFKKYPLTGNLLGMIPVSYNEAFVGSSSGLYTVDSSGGSGGFSGGGGSSGGGGAGRSF